MRLIDLLMILPRWIRLNKSERSEIEAYRKEKVFAKIGKNPALKKQIAAIKPPSQKREATLKEALALKNFGVDPVLDRRADGTATPVVVE